jgi:hypothetical protein
VWIKVNVTKIFVFYLTTMFNYKKDRKILDYIRSRNSYKRLLQKLDTSPVPCKYIFSVKIFVVIIRWNSQSNWAVRGLDTTNIINENMYWHGTGKIFNIWNSLVHELLDPTSAIILTILFVIKYIVSLNRISLLQNAFLLVLF